MRGFLIIIRETLFASLSGLVKESVGGMLEVDLGYMRKILTVVENHGGVSQRSLG